SFLDRQAQSPALEQKLDAFAQKIQRDLQLQTGFAIGIVKDGELILQKRYGFLNAAKKTPLTADTPFYIASTLRNSDCRLRIFRSGATPAWRSSPSSKPIKRCTRRAECSAPSATPPNGSSSIFSTANTKAHRFSPTVISPKC